MGGVYLGPPRTPAFIVSWSISPAALGSTLEAMAYWGPRPAPDGTKNAPFTIMSPSDLQFQDVHSFWSVSTRFVTCHWQAYITCSNGQRNTHIIIYAPRACAIHAKGVSMCPVRKYFVC